MTLQVKIDPRDGVLKEWDPGKKKYLGPIDPKLAGIIASLDDSNVHHDPLGIHPPQQMTAADLPGTPSTQLSAMQAAMGSKNKSRFPRPQKQTKAPMKIAVPKQPTQPLPVVVTFQGRQYAFDDTVVGGGRWRDVLKNGKLGKTTRGDIAFKLSQTFFPQFQAPVRPPKVPKGSRKNVPQGRGVKKRAKKSQPIKDIEAFTQALKNKPPFALEQSPPKEVGQGFSKRRDVSQILKEKVEKPESKLDLGASAAKEKQKLIIPSAPKPTFFTDINNRPDDNATPPKPQVAPTPPPRARVNLPSKSTTERVVHELKVLQRITGKIYGAIQKQGKASRSGSSTSKAGKPRASANPLVPGNLGHGDPLIEIAAHTLMTNLLLGKLVGHFDKDDEFAKARELEQKSHDRPTKLDKISKAIGGSGGNLLGGVAGLAGVGFLIDKLTHGGLEKIIETKIGEMLDNLHKDFVDTFTGEGTKAEYNTVGELIGGSIGAGVGAFFGGAGGIILGGIIGAVLGKAIVDAVNEVVNGFKHIDLNKDDPTDPKNRKDDSNRSRFLHELKHTALAEKDPTRRTEIYKQLDRFERGLDPIPDTSGGPTQDPDATQNLDKVQRDAQDQMNRNQNAAKKDGSASPSKETKRPTASPMSKISSKEAVEFFVKKGYTEKEAKAFVANMEIESDGDASKVNASGHTGLFQWDHDTRWVPLEKWAKQNNLDPNLPETQLEMFHHELQTTEGGSLSKLKKSEARGNSPYEMAALFRGKNERPGTDLSGYRKLHGEAQQLAMMKLDPVQKPQSEAIASAEDETARMQTASGATNVGVGGTTVNNTTIVNGSGGGQQVASTRKDGDFSSWWRSQWDAIRAVG